MRVHVCVRGEALSVGGLCVKFVFFGGESRRTEAPHVRGGNQFPSGLRLHQHVS